jgi:hypothetical protein
MLLIVSAFLVWAKVDIVIGTVSQTGMDTGYGWIDVLLGLAAAALVMAWAAGVPRKVVRIGWLVLGLGTAGLTAYELSSATDCAFFFSELDQCLANPQYGPGLFTAMAGAVAIVVAAALARPGRTDPA